MRIYIIFDIRLQKLPIRIYKFDMVVDNEIALLFNNFKYMFLYHIGAMASIGHTVSQ